MNPFERPKKPEAKATPPRYTKETVELLNAFYTSQREENLEAFLDAIAPLP
jgi:hypothetical protein